MRPSGASGRQWTIAAGDERAVVVEVGGGVREYAAGGVEWIDGYAADEMAPAWHGKVLAPWPNRLRDGRYAFNGAEQQLPLTEPARHVAMHGLVGWVRWYAEEEAADAVTLRYDLPPQVGYPWPLTLRTRWSVGPGGLRAEHTATNPGTDPVPFGLAVHPYLRVPGVAVDDLALQVPMRLHLLTDERLLPIGAELVAESPYDYRRPRPIGGARLDTAFGDPVRDSDGRVAASLTGPDGRGVRLWADQAFGWFQVFTSDALPEPRHRRSVAIEPMTCPPDAFRSGHDLVTIAPGETWRGTWGIEPV